MKLFCSFTKTAMDLCDNQAQCAVDVMLSFEREQSKTHGQLSLSRDDVVMMNTDLIFAGMHSPET